MHIHDGRTRLLVKLVSLVLAGVAVYFVLVYGILGSTQKVSIATTTSNHVPTSNSPVNATSSPVASRSAPSPAPSTTTPAPVATAGDTIAITNFQNNSTITLTKGQRAAVELGSGLNWTLAFEPASILAQVAAPESSSTQGTFEAKTTGTTTLTATGAPICKAHQACPMFLAVFKVTIVVK